MFGLGRVRGEFKLRDGHIDVTDSPGDCVVRAVASAASFDTGNPKRDRTVRSSTYLDSGKHPDLDFVADAVHSDGDTPVVDGTLTAHGVAAPLRITIDAIDAAAGELSLHASAQVDRHVHGITAGRGIAGRRLAIEIAAVATPE
jgi:polyisoprenoid-binding protein YceI